MDDLLRKAHGHDLCEHAPAQLVDLLGGDRHDQTDSNGQTRAGHHLRPRRSNPVCAVDDSAMACIKLDTTGPICSDKNGWGTWEGVHLYKFRSMHVDAERARYRVGLRA